MVRSDVIFLGGVEGKILVGGVELASLGVVELIEVLIKVVRGGNAVVGLAAHAELVQLGLKGLFAAVLVDIGLVACLDGGLLFVGERRAVFLGKIFQHQILLDGRKHIGLDVVGDARAVFKGIIPVERGAGVILHVAVKIRHVVARPVGDEVGACAVAVNACDDRVGRDAGRFIAEAGMHGAGGEAV